MSGPATKTAEAAEQTHDLLWARLRQEAEDSARREPALASFLHGALLSKTALEEAVGARVADRLGDAGLPRGFIKDNFTAMARETDWADFLRADLLAVFERDPACRRLMEPVLFFKGFHAIQCHRLAHWLWTNEREDLALYLQSRSSEVFQTDINPAVPMGRGVFIDHATGLVIGATAVIEDDVSLLQNVTLGGTGKERGDRHPKIRAGVLIGAGAIILGNIEVGPCSRVAAGSVVLEAVPPQVTVAGVPARIVGKAGCAQPARSMDQILKTFEDNGDDEA